MDEKGQADCLIKNVNDTAVENYKDRIYKDIFFLSQVPALSDEGFSQNLSGIAIKYKLVGLEELAVIKENKFRAAVKKKIKMVTEFINTKFNQNYNPATITLEFIRNVIENTAEIIDYTAKLEGMTSKTTQLQQLPFIDDPQAEFEKILSEQREMEGLGTIPDVPEVVY